MRISKSAMDKTFQPFFTTKPAGEGTGPGVSLSFDSIKAHGDDVNVENNEEGRHKLYYFLAGVYLNIEPKLQQ